MFALEIHFQDGVSPPETIVVRRPQALVGGSNYAHVIIEDMQALNYHLRILRDLGRKFSVRPTGKSEGEQEVGPPPQEFDGVGTVESGKVRLVITALDSDLTVREGEPPDRAGVRVLRQACAVAAPSFPAVVVAGAHPLVVSFQGDQPVYIGRSNQCAVRLDAADISARHARLGYENGSFWIEDLGSTNGTYLDGQQISGRVPLQPGQRVVLGREVSLSGVLAETQIERMARFEPAQVASPATVERRYPVVVAVSEVARPARLVLQKGVPVVAGRDPTCELWLGAPHVSRRHCSVLLTDDDFVLVTDESTNGTGYERGVLHKGEALEATPGEPHVLDFGGGVTLAVCFNEEQERIFVGSQGSPRAFDPSPRGERSGLIPRDPGTEEVMVQPSLGFPVSHEGRISGFLTRLFMIFRSSGVAGKLVVLFALGCLALIVIVVLRLLGPVLS